jgi:hypothetical protein
MQQTVEPSKSVVELRDEPATTLWHEMDELSDHIDIVAKRCIIEADACSSRSTS